MFTFALLLVHSPSRDLQFLWTFTAQSEKTNKKTKRTGSWSQCPISLDQPEANSKDCGQSKPWALTRTGAVTQKQRWGSAPNKRENKGERSQDCCHSVTFTFCWVKELLIFFRTDTSLITCSKTPASDVYMIQRQELPVSLQHVSVFIRALTRAGLINQIHLNYYLKHWKCYKVWTNDLQVN